MRFHFSSVLLVPWLCIVGCTDDSGSEDDGASSSPDTGSSSGSADTTASTTDVDDGAGMSGGQTGAGSPGEIVCGDSTCEAPQVCCLPLVAGEDPSCAEACEGSNAELACDGPEDCEGMACCGNLANGFACTAESACPEDLTQRCHGAEDCPDAAPCVPVTFGGAPLDVCMP